MPGSAPCSVILGLASVLAACAGHAEEADLGDFHRALTVCADGPTVDGIDVSKWQGTIDWTKVAASGIRFAFVRVSDGLTFQDGTFAQNWAGARGAGVIRGAYQYFRPGEDAVAQARLLIATMGPLQAGDLPPAIDIEDTDGETTSTLVAKIHQWVDTVEAELGVVPIVYTGKYFWNDYVGSGEFVDYPLWIPQYGPTCPDLPSPWTRWSFFQTSASGRVPGIQGAVDTNLFNGSLDDLVRFTVEDRPACSVVPPEGRVVDDGEPCFQAGGDPQYIRHETAGVGGSLQWTFTTSSERAANYGLWMLSFAEAGPYVFEVHTPAPFAQSQRASYQVRHQGKADTVLIDQSAVDGWSRVGEFDFSAGGDQWIRVDDNTGEPRSAETKLAFDAVRLTRTGLLVPDAGPLASGVDAAQEGSGEEQEGGGGCRISRRGAAGHLTLLLLLLVLWAGTQNSPRRSRLRSP